MTKKVKKMQLKKPYMPFNVSNLLILHVLAIKWKTGRPGISVRPIAQCRATRLPRSQRHTSLVVSVREPLAPHSPSSREYLSRLPVKTTRPQCIPGPSLLHCCQHIARTNLHSASSVLWLHRRASLELALPAWMTWGCTPSYVPVLCHPDTLKHILLFPPPLQTSGLLVWRVSHTHGQGIPWGTHLIDTVSFYQLGNGCGWRQSAGSTDGYAVDRAVLTWRPLKQPCHVCPDTGTPCTDRDAARCK